jgi:hypothetical protein
MSLNVTAAMPPGRRRNAMRIAAGGAIALLCFWATLKLSDQGIAPPSTPHPIVPRSAPVTDATAVGQLPALPSPYNFAEEWEGSYDVRWDDIDGLNARASPEKPIIRAYPTLELVALPVEGLHRLGVKVRGLAPGVVYQIAFWTKAAAGTKIGLDVRDITSTNSGAASFDLANQKVLSSAGKVRGMGVEAGSDQWYKPWVQLFSADGGLVAYLVLLNSDGGGAYKGDGQTVILFGGIEVKPAL